MVVYPAGKGQPLKATYWDNEAHTIQYTVQPVGGRQDAHVPQRSEPGRAPVPPDLFAEGRRRGRHRLRHRPARQAG